MSAFSAQAPRAIKDLLSRRSDGPAQLYTRALELARIQQLLQSELPSPLREHLYVAGYDDKSMLLFTDGPAWAARLRFQIPAILALARSRCGLPSVENVRIRVTISPLLSSALPRRPRLSASAAETLRRSAESVSDPGLRDRLLRLSRRR